MSLYTMKMTTADNIDKLLEVVNWGTVQFTQNETQKGLYVDQLAGVNKEKTNDGRRVIAVQENSAYRYMKVRIANVLTASIWQPQLTHNWLKKYYPNEWDAVVGDEDMGPAEYRSPEMEDALGDYFSSDCRVTLNPAVDVTAKVLHNIINPSHHDPKRYWVQVHRRLLQSNRNYFNDIGVGTVGPYGDSAYRYKGEPTKILTKASEMEKDAMAADW